MVNKYSSKQIFPIDMFKLFFLLSLVSLGFSQDKSKENETITKLDLSNSGITSLNDYDFTKYPQLEELDLSNNLIENIKEHTFTKNTHLKKLNLSGNTKLKIPEYSTLLVSNIEELNLSNCNIEVFPPSILDGLVHLKSIDLSANPLTNVKLITFTNLFSPEKIILPNLNDKKAITEICNELNITIEDTETILQCSDVRNKKWEGEKKRNVLPDSLSSADNKHQPSNVTVIESNISKQQPEGDIKNTITPEIIETPAEPKVVEKKEVKTEFEETNNNNASKPESSLVRDVTHDESETNVVVDTQPEAPPVHIVETLANANKTDTLEPVSEVKTLSPQKSDSQPETYKESLEKPNNVSEVKPLNEQNQKPTIDQNIPEKNDESKTEKLMSNSKPNTFEEETKPTNNQTDMKPAPPSIGVQHAAPILPIRPLEDDSKYSLNIQHVAPLPIESESDKKKSMQQLNVAEDRAGASTGATTQPSTGTNILIFLVVAVIISGIAAFGYRFYKTRNYNPTNTQEPVERELQEIVTENKANGPTLSNVLEEEPLMHTNENTVEIKQIDEPKPNHVNATLHTSPTSKPYVPITTITPGTTQQN